MMEPCVTHAVSSQYLEFVGSALSVQTMTCVQFVTTETSIIYVIDSTGLPALELKGN